ncbi:MAG: cysteine hydrolase [Spirochaetes bacterium]|nr:cysteine hydrolase [Spirochaetota bacterium]
MSIRKKQLLSILLLTITVFAAGGFNEKTHAAQNKWKQTAFLIIDIQNDYFKNGAMQLENSEKSGENAGKLLNYFRKNGVPVIHIRHENTNAMAGFFLPGTNGAKIHKYVEPKSGETIILKHFPDSFMETDLNDVLKKRNIIHLIISGMQSNVCVRATTLKALEKKYTVTVAEDTLAAVNQATHKSAVDEIKKAGAKITSSSSLMK